MLINLDIHELFFFIEGCAHGSHLRQGIWERCIDEFYGKLTQEERDCLYYWSKRDLWECMCGDKYPNVKDREWGNHVGRDDYRKFIACYDCANRYLVTVTDGKKTETRPAYLFEGTYWVSFTSYAPKDMIIKIKKV